MRISTVNASAIGLLRVLLALSLLVPVVLFVLVSWLNYRATIQDAGNDLERTAEVAREHAEKIFDSQAQLADRVNELTRGMDAAAVTAGQQALHATLNEMVARLPTVSSVVIVSESGKPLVSARVFPVPPKVDLGTRDYFQAIVDDHKNLFVGALHTGELLRTPIFGLAWPWTDANETLKGAINVAVSPTYFEDFYQALVDEGMSGVTGKVVTLVRDDGKILVRDPPVKGQPPSLGTPHAFLAAIRASPEGGVYRSRSVIDPAAPLRLFAYRKVRGYPLYVAAGRSWNAIMADWRAAAMQHLLFGAPITLMLFAVTWTALVRTIREERALSRANFEIQRREAAEEAMLRSQRLEAVGQLTGGVAHDFNNLLTVIAGNAALIERRADDPAAARRYALSITLAAQRGAEITHHLLAFAGRQTIQPEIIDLNERLVAFKPLLDRAVNETVRIGLDLADGLPPVSVDPGQFESAILNLVANARDAMPDGGGITIASRKSASPEPSVLLAVSDTGTGMDPATAAKAFEPFFTTKDVGKGTGLGLSQVYGFTRQAGGGARIISAPGKGTTIEMTLPASLVLANKDKAERVHVSGHAPGSVVLVVEDEPSVLRMAVETLEDLGYGVVAAKDAASALRQLRQSNRVDVLFTDMIMPGGMNGQQLSAEARQLRPGLKVLMTSGYIGFQTDALPRDITLLPKPYNREQLSTQLESLLVR